MPDIHHSIQIAAKPEVVYPLAGCDSEGVQPVVGRRRRRG